MYIRWENYYTNHRFVLERGKEDGKFCAELLFYC